MESNRDNVIFENLLNRIRENSNTFQENEVILLLEQHLVKANESLTNKFTLAELKKIKES